MSESMGRPLPTAGGETEVASSMPATGITSGQSNGTVEITPSNIAVYFASRPKRVYKISQLMFPYNAGLESLIESAEDEIGDWREVPSVTTVLGVLDKSGPLVWWAMKIGIEGVMQLVENDDLLYRGHREPHCLITTEPAQATVEDVVALLTEHKLTVNHVRDKAGDRGQAVHDALENWARHGHRPDPSIYPEEQEGYVRGLLAFLDDVPSAEPEGAEVLVASVEYGYAGRYDLRLRTNEPHEVVVRRTATRVKKRELKPGRYLCDLKTSKNIYASHSRQLEAYEVASIESGYDPTDGRGILLVTPDGNYEFRRSWATFADFECVLRVWQSEEEMKQRKKAA